jgi:thiamine-monophosphate kinase
VRADIIDVPTYPGATLEQALHGGDDYELLFTLPGPKMPARRGLFIVGRIHAGDPAVTYRGNPIEPRGYDHFH